MSASTGGSVAQYGRTSYVSSRCFNKVANTSVQIGFDV
jgi:hypothetical protein